GRASMLMPTIAAPRPRDAFATTSGSSWNVVALTMAAARRAGSPDLKMPEPTKTPSAPSCIIIAASAGVAMPPAVNSTTGSLAPPRHLGGRVVGGLQLLRRGEQLLGGQAGQPPDALAERAHVPGRLHDVAGAGLALGPDHRRPLGDPPQGLAQVGRAAHERHG